MLRLRSERFRIPVWITAALPSFFFFFFSFFLSKRQVWSRSMSVVWPFITEAMKASLMDMKAQSIVQEREIREGWVTIFLLLDNHVMPCSLSRDVADWCLSFISPALIWRSTCFYNHISRKSISHQPLPLSPPVPTCRAEYAFSFVKKNKNKTKLTKLTVVRGTSLSIDHILKQVIKK